MYAPVSMLTAVYTLPNIPSPNDNRIRLDHFVHTKYFFIQTSTILGQHQMHERRTIAINDPIARESVNQSTVNRSAVRSTVLTHSPDGTILMQPLLDYSSHLLVLFISLDLRTELLRKCVFLHKLLYVTESFKLKRWHQCRQCFTKAHPANFKFTAS